MKQYLHNIHKNNNTTNHNNTNRINLYYRNQMQYNFRLDRQAITNIIKRHIKPIEKQKQIKLIIYYTKLKTSNLIVKNNTNSAKIHLNQSNVDYEFLCPFRECLSKNKNNSYISQCKNYLYIIYCIAIQPQRYLTYPLSENSAIKQHLIIKHNNNTNQFTSSYERKILTDNNYI